jgi:hypothetical protein
MVEALVNVGRGATCLEKVVEEKGVSRKHNAEGALSKTQDHDLQAKDSKSNVQTVIVALTVMSFLQSYSTCLVCFTKSRW